ncbi:MAG: glycoside hydrolase family 30 protein [Chitinophagaceae bacterium]
MMMALLLVQQLLFGQLQDSTLVAVWFTKADQTQLLQRQAPIYFSSRSGLGTEGIVVNDASSYQPIRGLGFALTGGSAYHIMKMGARERAILLQELFGRGDHSIGISYLRISIGASDLDPEVFSYDDLPPQETDENLVHFQLGRDTLYLLPLLREILSIDPELNIMASPWSAPVWMKSNRQSKGGRLLRNYYSTYAQYFVKYILSMRQQGIPIDAITPQNEPLHPGNNPSMYMEAEEQRDFIKDYLGPAFSTAGLATKIVVYDHNCNRPDYPITILNDSLARTYVAGSAFHLYEGDILVLTKVKDSHPDKDLYFTEQWTGAKGSFREDLLWHTKNVVIGALRNWSTCVLEWNLASDEHFEPHTPGGCTECKGALTITGNRIQKNVSYYIIAHASKFLPRGSVRIHSSPETDFPQVVFRTPEGRTVMLLLNEKEAAADLQIFFRNQQATLHMPSSCVATLVW